MSNFTLAMIAPEVYELENFELDGDLWTATSGDTTISRDTSHDSPRESVMEILGNGAAGDADGVTKDFTVVAGMTWFFSCLYKCDAGALRIMFSPLPSGSTISYVDKTETSWTLYETSFTIPAACTSVRISLLQTGSNQGPYYVDDLSFQPSVIDKDADAYTRDPIWVGSLQQNLGGRRVSDLRSVHHSFILHWNFLTEAQFEFLREAFNAGERMYFDDGDVPQMAEKGVYRSNETLTFSGITKPSSTHKAYEDNDDAMPTAKGDLETTEFATADYQAVDGDDSNYADTISSMDMTAGDYLFHKFCLESGIASADAQRVRFKVMCSADDADVPYRDGCILYGWNGTAWVKLDSHSSTTNAELAFREMISTEAAKFVDTGDDYIRLLLKTRGTGDATGAWVKKASRYDNGDIYELLVFDSKLYGVNHAGHLVEWDESSAWVSKGDVGVDLLSMCEYDSTIYVGTDDGRLFEWDGTDTLTEVAPDVDADVSDSIVALVEYDDGGGDDLYGVHQEHLLRWNGVNAWVKVGDKGVANLTTGIVWNSKLYVGSGGGELYEWDDDDTLVEKADAGTAIMNMVEFNGELYCTGNDGKLYLYNGSSSLDAVTAAYPAVSLYSVVVHNSKIYAGTDTGLLLEYDAANSLLLLKAPAFNLEDIWDLVVFEGALYAGGTDDEWVTSLQVLTASAENNLRTYYVESEVNEDLDNVIHLSHRAILTAGAVVSVKNLTEGTTLTTPTHYAVASDRRSVTVSSGATDGDEIEVTYNRYWETMFRDVPERWFSGDPSSARHRAVDIILDTIEGD